MRVRGRIGSREEDEAEREEEGMSWIIPDSIEFPGLAQINFMILFMVDYVTIRAQHRR